MQSVQKNSGLLAGLPPSFLQFLKSRNIPLEYFQITPPRYIRLRNIPALLAQQQKQSQSPEQIIAADLEISSNDVTRINQHFFAIPADVNINQSKLYNKGFLYGMDVSSGWTVQALDPKPGNHILELCCAPGNKLMYISDLINEQNMKNLSTQKEKQGVIRGVDISKTRIQTTLSLIKKYGHSKQIEIFCEDALKFDKFPVEQSAKKYDKILVDAECTHEGSVKHLKKFVNQVKKKEEPTKLSKKTLKQMEKNSANTYTSQRKSKNEWTQEDFEERFLDKKKLENLQALQGGLIRRAWELLEQGGYLVYSTCSFDQSQNEEIVEEFLSDKEGEAELVFPFSKEAVIPYQKSRLMRCLRFNPVVSKTGGMFIAKIRKIVKSEKI